MFTNFMLAYFVLNNRSLSCNSSKITKSYISDINKRVYGQSNVTDGQSNNDKKHQRQYMNYNSKVYQPINFESDPIPLEYFEGLSSGPWDPVITRVKHHGTLTEDIQSSNSVSFPNFLPSISVYQPSENEKSTLQRISESIVGAGHIAQNKFKRFWKKIRHKKYDNSVAYVENYHFKHSNNGKIQNRYKRQPEVPLTLWVAAPPVYA